MMNTRKERSMRRGRLASRLALCGAVLLGGTPAAHAGWLDGLLAQGPAPTTSAGARQRTWAIREFTRIELVPREAGSEPNQHPATLQADALRQLLGQIRFVDRNGAQQALFAAGELADLAAPLAQALGRAGPGDDVLLLSSSRRDGGVLVAPSAVTARLFVQGGSLQFIVRDARFEFFDAYRGTQAAPRFAFGSRAAAGATTLQSAGATNPRSDWLSIPMPLAAPQTGAAPAAAPAPAPAVQAAPPAAARKALDAAAVDDIERRLETLKRLREKGLITEDEYQQKRREILQLL